MDRRTAVEFGIGIGEYEGVVRIPRRVFQSLDQAPTPERCLEIYHLDRTRFELIAEHKLRRRQFDRRPQRQDHWPGSAEAPKHAQNA